MCKKLKVVIMSASLLLVFSLNIIAENKMNNRIDIHIVKYEMEGVSLILTAEKKERIYPFVRYVGNIKMDNNLNMKYDFLDEKEGFELYNKFEEAKKYGFKGNMQYGVNKPVNVAPRGELIYDNKLGWYWSGMVTKEDKEFIEIFIQNTLFDKGYSIIDDKIGEKYLQLKAPKEIERKELLDATILPKGYAIYQRNFKVVKESTSYPKPQKSKKKYSAYIVDFKLYDINNHIDNDKEDMQRVAPFGSFLGKIIIKNNKEIICDFYNVLLAEDVVKKFEESKINGVQGEKYYNVKPKSFPKNGTVEYLEDEKVWHWKGIATVEDESFAEIFVKNMGYPEFNAYNVMNEKYAKYHAPHWFVDNDMLQAIYLEYGEKIYEKDYILLKYDKQVKEEIEVYTKELIQKRREEMSRGRSD